MYSQIQSFFGHVKEVKVFVFIKTNETLPTFFQYSLTLGEKGTKTQDQNQD